ncbi:acryloyl-CoA reductase [Micromonospora vulcania]|uniref:Acryloyl-CoA reductase n=1 Tax=Micromonospora vulcania TaxID=1441873 RepID=A0ABW1H6I9_9ACTN
MSYTAVRVDKVGDALTTELTQLDDREPQAGEVVVDVEYSNVNYKDGLAIDGKFGFIQRFPRTAGIDLAGVVSASADPAIAVGTRVSVNGWGLSITHDGGFAQRAHVPAEWITILPDGLDTATAAALGTAGLAAAMSVNALAEHDVTPDSGPVLVTGATGGAGSIAVLLLAHRGYRVAASTGKPAEADYLRRLGATDIIDRAELSEPLTGLLKGERWAGAVDAVGSHTLANVLAQIQYGGTVAAFGLAQGIDLPVALTPFITRGVTLAGIDTVWARPAVREAAWALLDEAVDRALLAELTRTIGLAEAAEASLALLSGAHRGRLVVDVNA